MQQFRYSYFLFIGLVFSFSSLIAQNVGIGTSSPLTRLHVAGTFRVDALQTPAIPSAITDKVVWTDVNGQLYSFSVGAIGQVLGVNALGVIDWLDADVYDWHLEGNSNGGLYSIGTNDGFDFPIVTNSVERMRVMADGKIGLATISPTTLLDINGDYAYRVKNITNVAMNNNNYDLTTIKYSSYRITNTTGDDFTYSGFTGGSDGRIVTLYNASNEVIDLINQSSASVAANRIITGQGGDISIDPEGAATLQYNTFDNRWVVIALNGVEAGNNWSLAGNAVTNDPNVPATYGTSLIATTENFAGTIDAQDYVIGTNRIERLRVKKTTGYIGIGTAVPTTKLHVKGNVTIDSTVLTHGITVGKSAFVQGPNTSADNQYHNVVLPNDYAMTALSIYATTKLDGDMKVNGIELKNVLNNASQGWYGLNAGVSAAGTGTNTVATGADYQDHNCQCPDNYIATGIEIRAYLFLDGEMKLRCTALKPGYLTSETGQGVEAVLSVPFYVGANDQSHISGCPAGTYVKGVRIRAEDYLDGQLRVFCTGIEH